MVYLVPCAFYIFVLLLVSPLFMAPKHTRELCSVPTHKKLWCLLRRIYLLDKPRQHIKKQRHHFANKGPSSQGYGFSISHVHMWELDPKEGWAPKNDAFELWCWRRLLRVLWTARRSNQSNLKETNPEYSLEGLMLKLKLQHFGHPMQRADSLEKTSGEGDNRGWDGWMASLTQWTWVQANSGRWWRTGKPGMLQSTRLQRVGYDLGTEEQQQTFFN